jgi:hypothetical protein
MLRWGEKPDIRQAGGAGRGATRPEGDIYAAQQAATARRSIYLKALELLLEVAFESDHNLAAGAATAAALEPAGPGRHARWPGRMAGHYQDTLAALPTSLSLPE